MPARGLTLPAAHPRGRVANREHAGDRPSVCPAYTNEFCPKSNKRGDVGRGGDGGGVHGCSPWGSGSCTSALKRGMYMPNASWRRRGVATASRGVSPPLQRERSGSGKGVAQRRSAQAKRGRLGSGLRARGDSAPLSGFCFCRCFSEGRCGEAGPPRWGG